MMRDAIDADMDLDSDRDNDKNNDSSDDNDDTNKSEKKKRKRIMRRVSVGLVVHVCTCTYLPIPVTLSVYYSHACKESLCVIRALPCTV